MINTILQLPVNCAALFLDSSVDTLKRAAVEVEPPSMVSFKAIVVLNTLANEGLAFFCAKLRTSAFVAALARWLTPDVQPRLGHAKSTALLLLRMIHLTNPIATLPLFTVHGVLEAAAAAVAHCEGNVQQDAFELLAAASFLEGHRTAVITAVADALHKCAAAAGGDVRLSTPCVRLRSVLAAAPLQLQDFVIDSLLQQRSAVRTVQLLLA